MKANNEERAAELDEIRAQMKDLVEQAFRLVRGTDEEHRAKAYWYGQIHSALDDESYPGGMHTMADSQEALEGGDDLEYEEGEDYGPASL
jgi:hypothetical protein